ncbi:LysR substrate-binding domain-containing protein [Orrella sp. 11846]|uniref:LysR substrate-binding domain-containing protein n=1 Tax=Orrella sp. 11846 TaxID=3409913 RepID=UPI003B5B2BB8
MRKGIPNLGALQAFEATARLGSFSRAADELSLTHSAVHRQVSSLEQRLGVALFVRVRRRITLTEQGEQYATRIRQHLEQISKDTFSLMSEAELGSRLHLAVLPTLAAHWLIPRLPDFQRHHSSVSVSLSLRTLPFQFGDHPFDAAIYHSRAFWPGTVGVCLFDEEALLPVCAPFLKPAEQMPAKLTHLHLNSRQSAWRDWYAQAGLEYQPQVEAGPRYEVFTMVLAGAKAGLGVGLVPRFLAQDALDRGELVLTSDVTLPVPESYYFGYPAHSEPSDSLRAFEAWLIETVKTQQRKT